MPLDRTAFFMGSYAEADIYAQSGNLTPEEKLAWVNRTVKAAYGYDPDLPLKLDRTAFSMRKHFSTLT